ncbi:hypothetical protein SASC598O11_002860 [Snodgrassella alvi SCGC AB-598-O11]|nr:hypothetical protein SASC598O11_002860 [Snodgrassella alvi SCGC AB-598-O11]
MAVWVYLLFVIPVGLHFCLCQVVDFGNADAVLTGNNAVKAARQCHDAVYGMMGSLQHVVVVGINRDVGMDIAVTGMHMQGNEDTAADDMTMNFVEFFQYQGIGFAAEYFCQWLHDVAFDGYAQMKITHGDKAALVASRFVVFKFLRKLLQIVGQWCVEMVEQPCPAGLDTGDVIKGMLFAGAEQLGAGKVGIEFIYRQFGLQIFDDGRAQGKFVLNRQLNVDAFDTVGIAAKLFEWNNDVLPDLRR